MASNTVFILVYLNVCRWWWVDATSSGSDGSKQNIFEQSVSAFLGNDRSFTINKSAWLCHVGVLLFQET